MSEEKKHIKYIVYLQIIGIILIVFGHSVFYYPDGNHGASSLIYSLPYSFRIPLFLFVSGYLMHLTSFRDKSPGSEISVLGFTVKKIKRLLLPFVVLTFLAFLPKSLMGSIAEHPISLDFSSLLRALFFKESMVIPYLWFLQASILLLTCVFCIIYISRKISIKFSHTAIFLVTLFVVLAWIPTQKLTFFSISQACNMGIYFIGGVIYCQYERIIEKHITWSSLWCLMAFAAVWIILFFESQSFPELTFLVAFSGIAMCMSLAHILVKHNIRVLDHLTGANYIIFLLSWFFNVTAQQILHHFFPMPWWIHSLLSLISGIYIPWLFYRIMCHTHNNKATQIISLLLGQNIRSTKNS